MSLQQDQTIQCSRCHNAYNVAIWSSVNVTLDPTLKKRVLDRSIFRGSCPACGHIVELEYDCLYHDMERKWAVWLKLPNERGVMSMESLPLRAGELSFDDYTLRIVTDFPTLLEKVHCIDNELDDLVIELVKSVVFQKLHGAAPIHSSPFYFAGFRRRMLRSPVLDFVSVTTAGEQWYDMPFSPLYPTASQQLHLLAPQGVPRGRWQHVNAAYLEALGQ